MTKALLVISAAALVAELAAGCTGDTGKPATASTGAARQAGAYVPPQGMDEEDTAKSLFAFLAGKGMDVDGFQADDGDPNVPIQLSGWKTFVFKYKGEDEFIEIAPTTEAVAAWVAKIPAARQIAVTFGGDSTIMFYPNGNRNNAEGYGAAMSAAQRVADLTDGKLFA